MNTLELELTYLAKYLPENLASFPSKEIFDMYIPENSAHATLRLRKNGENYEMTKKEPVGNDVSIQTEQTITLRQEEFDAFSSISTKTVRKIRYAFPVGEYTAEIDVFEDKLKGLVLIDFEFATEAEKDAFTPPEFCFKEITQEKWIAGGYLSGKSYADIEENLLKFGYAKII